MIWGGVWIDGVYKNTSLTIISVKASTPQKCHYANHCTLLNNWHLTMPKISTEPPLSHPQLDTYTSIKILTDPYLRSSKNSGSVFKAHKTPFILKAQYHQIGLKKRLSVLLEKATRSNVSPFHSLIGLNDRGCLAEFRTSRCFPQDHQENSYSYQQVLFGAHILDHNETRE